MNAYILYDIYVTTSNIRGAGTDANVFIQIFGKRADTGRFNILAIANIIWLIN